MHDKSKGKYGWRTIQMKLKSDMGIVMNHKKYRGLKLSINYLQKLEKLILTK